VVGRPATRPREQQEDREAEDVDALEDGLEPKLEHPEWASRDQ